MPGTTLPFPPDRPLVAGAFGDAESLSETTAGEAFAACDLVELRLDLLAADGAPDPAAWSHLADLPKLFTARRADEGGGRDPGPAGRAAWLEAVLGEAACLDIELASVAEAGGLIAAATAAGVPWIASFHDFGRLPAPAVLADAAARARDAGAAAFKLAARLHQPADLARLAEFQLADHGLPLATMGMGPLAPVSRLLCAQCGSVLNYGYLGRSPTAPGQWDAARLRDAIRALAPLDPPAPGLIE